MTSSGMQTIVIIGAGHCGGRSALLLRANGWAGRIVLIGREHEAPYERPALSKGFLTDEQSFASLQLSMNWHEAGIELLTDCQVMMIDRQDKAVHLDDGTVISYQQLLIATGGSARALPVVPECAPWVCTLRTHADALRIKAALTPGKRLLLVGGGFICLELAATAVQAGCRVTLIETADRLLGRSVPQALGDAVTGLHREHGVMILLDSAIDTVQCLASGDGLRVCLRNGSVLEADLLVAGIGMLPATELARQAGLEVDSGILVDASLRTSDPAIFAAGDVCQFPCPYTGKRIRQETWENAERQAAVAAVNLTGGAARYTSAPWFWSDQYDRSLQVGGDLTGEGEDVWRVSDEARILIRLNTCSQPVGFAGLARQGRGSQELKLVRKLTELGVEVDRQALADPAVALKSLLRRTERA